MRTTLKSTIKNSRKNAQKAQKLQINLLCILCLFVANSASAKYSGGSGTANDPYRIGNAADLLALAADTNDYDANFILIADINLASYTFTAAVIAPGDYHSPAFTGSFDGNERQITNLTINTNNGSANLGLFGRAYFSEIKNLEVANFSITSDSGIGTAGGLVGWNGNSSINNCNSTGIIACGNGSGALGGLVGNNNYGTITDSNSMANVTCGNSSHGLGGLVGENDGTISHCFATGNVSGYNNGWKLDVTDLGGLVGGNSGTISDSNATGNVTAGYCYIANLGGLAGSNIGGTISNCFATGTVTGDGNTSGNCIVIGGLIGSSSGTISNCFATGDVNGNYYSYENGGLVGINSQ